MRGVLSDLLARVWLSLWVEPGDLAVGHAVERLGAPQCVDWLSGNRNRGRGQSGPDFSAPPEYLLDDPEESARRALSRAHRAGTRVLTPIDCGWPRSLRDLGLAAPLLLFVSGSAADLAGQRIIALVGTRRASPAGIRAAEVIARDQALQGRTVVTGGARGIDIAAHRAAVAAGGATVVALASHQERPYPSEHRDDFLVTPGAPAVISEMPPGRETRPHHFLARNRLIAALSSMTVLVEAGYRSGAVNTCRHAAQLGRSVAAVQWEDHSPGSERVITQYAAAPIPWPG